MISQTVEILDQIPRDVEFTYNPKIEKLRPLVGTDTLVPYTTLLQKLHLPKAHFDDKEPMKPMVCPSDCRQKQSCQRIRETLSLVHLVAKKLGERGAGQRPLPLMGLQALPTQTMLLPRSPGRDRWNFEILSQETKETKQCEILASAIFLSLFALIVVPLSVAPGRWWLWWLRSPYCQLFSIFLSSPSSPLQHLFVTFSISTIMIITVTITS